MDPLESFVRELLEAGRVRFEGNDLERGTPGPGAASFLREAFRWESLDLAGPAPPFPEKVAVAAAMVTREACWALVDRREAPEDLAARLRMPGPPRRSEDHLAADLTFRYLPGVHRRARALDRADPLAALLADLLRAWPLSGVMADLDDGPATPPDLGDHPGVCLLYAERMGPLERPEWRPVGVAETVVEWLAEERDSGRVRIGTGARLVGGGHA